MNNTLTKPDQSMVIVGEPSKQFGHVIATQTIGTRCLNFESVQHLLSDKPLRRPNRVRPLPRD